MHRICAGALALFVTLLIPRVLADQESQRPRFVSTTDYVTTEVIVRDARGVFLPNLTIKDFVLLEDGVPQTLTTFVRVQGGRATTQVANPPVRGEGLILPPAKEEQPGRIFAIFIDDRHIQPSNSNRPEASFRRFATRCSMTATSSPWCRRARQRSKNR